VAVPDPRGGVLVTGASSGIGEATALRLDRAGFRVFAGVRGAAAGEALRGQASERLTVVQPLDVTDPAQIDAARAEVEAALGATPLRGIVNNAGVALGGPLEAIDLDILRRQLELNAIAPVAVAQAFLPLLRRSRGRIVNISSIGGLVAQPFIGPYAASKFAVEALSASLRLELVEWGIDVIAIAPGTIATPIWDKGTQELDEQLAALSPEHRELYGKRLAKLPKTIRRMAKQGVSPDRVARKVEHALTAERPRTHYLVGDAFVLLTLKRLLPARAFDRLMYRLTS
jgi:NAD(P)-dependent dehydrogenase (short-subunit alcohol dehydrogenase family)